MAVATYQDVEVALGRPMASAAEQAQVEWWLAGVELIIGVRLGDVSLLDQDVLRYAEVETVVAKVQRAGSTLESRTVSTDDGSLTERYQSVTTQDITDEWWNLLDPNVGTGVYSVRPGFEADDVGWAVRTPPEWPGVWSATE